jgi:hypothetical protein
MTARVLGSLLLMLLGFGCTPAAKVTWHRDVAPIVERKCGTCHQEGGVAPFSLGSLAEWSQYEAASLAAIRAGRMPPFPAKLECAQYTPTQALLPDQREVIDAWLASGKPEGDARDFRPLPGTPDKLTRVDVSVSMPEAFTPTKSPDEYRCFLIDWPFTDTRFITGYELRPGQKSMLHHADLFFINPSFVAQWASRDTDPGPGWECYDIPFGREGQWIGTYVPGMRGNEFPPGTGLRVPPGAKVFLQMHYNALAGQAGPDQSVLDLRLEKRVQKVAGIQALSDPKWLSRQMRIPAGKKDVLHRFDVDPTPLASIISEDFVDGRPMKLYATTMHLHQLGQSARFEVLHPDGTSTCIVDIPKWDFHWQLAYTLTTPVVVNPGDQLSVQCTFDNTAENQPFLNGVKVTPRDRNWGSRTEDEMCVGGILVSQ